MTAATTSPRPVGSASPGQASPSSPVPRRLRRPTWLDLRLVLGFGLVLSAVLAGASILSGADHRTPVWAVRHDLAAGTVLRSADLAVVPTQLGSSSDRYLPSSAAVVGKALAWPLRAGELLPRSGLDARVSGIEITVPLGRDQGPRLRVGQRVILWLSTKSCRAAVVVSGPVVQDVWTTGGGALSGADTAFSLRLEPTDASRVMGAVDAESAVLRVGVLADGQNPPPATEALDTCMGGQ
ncbi:SAF domain-containing protein [Jatrophihabitans telluris]|uniref:SAF domain-containing protein n=1 Tax=Jatrophihabitans telluris TaxID=2038343 RepID=A0ABY4R2I9_9ACTN|nr:SAF domain-containing protein [Jatrophihabitans telluris]UQX89692.1 SAF domain-containing protein [Jatrophihabitans telluris]